MSGWGPLRLSVVAGLLAMTGATSIILRAGDFAFTTYAGAAPGAVDGVGPAARFHEPIAVALDQAGNLYVADAYNSTVRKVAPDRTVTTLAGLAGQPGSVDGVGGAARFLRPFGVAADGFGNVFVADNNAIRKITPDRQVTTLAGLSDSLGSSDGTGSAARFATPEAVAPDRTGNLYVADFGNHTIRRITPGGDVTTLAGLPGVFGSVDGVGSEARFYWPVGVAVDGAGNVFVSDWENGTENGTIRMITPDRAVTTLAGQAGTTGDADGPGGLARFSGPYGLAADGAGHVYVADSWNCSIRLVSTVGTVTTWAGLSAGPSSRDGVAGAARFNQPGCIAVDPNRNAYVAEGVSGNIRKVAADGTVTTLFEPMHEGRTNFLFSTNVVLSTNLVVSTNCAGPTNCIVSTNLVVVTNLNIQRMLFFPEGIAVDPRGLVYITDAGGNTVERLGADGQLTPFAGLAGHAGSADGVGANARFNHPSWMAMDRDGVLYVADSGNWTIRRITPEGNVSTLAGQPGVFGSRDGPGIQASFNSPGGVAVNRTGIVYVADSGANTIRRIDRTGLVTTIAGLAGAGGSADGTGAGARFLGPGGLAVDSMGVLYVADSDNCTIRRVTPEGVVTTLGGWPGQSGSVDGIGDAARFYVPLGLAVDDADNLYIADALNNTIRKGVPALPDVPIIRGRFPPFVQTSARTARQRGPLTTPAIQVGQTLVLCTSPQTATIWDWRLIRRPAGSTAELSATNTADPTFVPDVSDVYVFDLRAGNAAGDLSIRKLAFTATGAPVRLSNPGVAGSSFSVSVLATGGTSYVLQYKDTLSATNWSALAPVLLITNGTLVLTDPLPTAAQRFYRVAVSP